MQVEIEDPQNNENGDKINYSRIFKAIAENELTTEEKVIQLTKYLHQGADINAIDTNNNNNTLLHVAAITGNIKMFELLLNKGANYNITNNDNHTVVDIIECPGTINGKDLSNTFYKKYGSTKRKGTSAVKGNLYETKLISLILVRALHNTKEFILGTNVNEMGALDDIVLRYKTENMQKSKIIILQTKHRENEKWSVEYILKLAYEYYESYLLIRQKICTENNNIMFKNSNGNIECEFVIYTSAKEYVTKNKNTKNIILVEENLPDNSLIKTSENGKVFKFQYDKVYFDGLVSTLTKWRIKTLAKTLAKFILKDKFENMLADDLMKTYHIFLAQNVIKKCNLKKSRSFIQLVVMQVGKAIALRLLPITLLLALASTLRRSVKSSSEVHEKSLGRFRSKFLTSKDEDLVYLKHEICKEIAKSKRIILDHQQSKVENIMKSLTFKLPNDFGNPYFHFTERETKPQTRLNHLYSILNKLFKNNLYKDSKYIYIRHDDDSVNTNNTVQKKDFKLCWLGGLVGDLLIYDNETEMLKINMNEHCLSNDIKTVFQKLKQNYDLSVYRFDINIYGFPKLALSNKKNDEKLVSDFLTQLKIYTDQSQEHEVEIIIKEEISQLLNKREQKHLSDIRDLIFSSIHEKIQKWSLRAQSPYLTKFHNFYHEAIREISSNFSQLKKIHDNYIKKITNTPINFETEAVRTLELNRLLDSDKKCMVIFSDDVPFSTIKTYQHFTEIIQEYNNIFITIDSENIENHLKVLLDELDYSIIPICVIISIVDMDINLFYQTKSAILIKKCKFVIIIHNKFKEKLNTNSEIIYQTDRNSFSSLSSNICKKILEDRKVIFQGQEVTVNTVLDATSLNLLSTNLLRTMIYGEKIVIGNKITDNFFTKSVQYYVSRTLYRCIKLNTNEKNHDLCFITDSSIRDSVPQETKDIVVITDTETLFENACTIHNKSNIHWFILKKYEENICIFDEQNSIFVPTLNYNHIMVWKKTHGSLQGILKYVDREYKSTGSEFKLQPKTLKDIDEKIVIISAESGMGKSTLLTHLAINTKLIHPSLWIIKINLLDDTVLDQLNHWNKYKIKIDVVELLKFFYSKVSYNKNCDIHEISKLININDKNEINLNEYDDTDLSEFRLFNHFYNNNNLAILFDGFDEICPDYANEVIELLCVLKTSKVAHLWVTSRPYNTLEQLESALGSFSHQLNPLTMMEQKQYLQVVWHHQLGLELLQDTIMHIDTFYSTIKNGVIIDKHFISLPLHLFMFAEIYQNDLKHFLDLIKSHPGEKLANSKNTTNLITFYEKFTNKKFEIQFGEKNSSMNSKDPTIKNIKENKRKEYFENHKKLTAYYFLDKDILLTDYDIKQVEKFIKDINSGIEKTGIVEWRVDNHPTFIHITFAEYFGAEFIFDKLRSNNCKSLIWKHFIDDILTDYGIGIRTFINSKLQSDQSIFSHLKDNTEQMKSVFAILLAQFHQLRVTAIYVAIKADLEHTSIFLVECLKSVLVVNKKKSSDFLKLINMKCNRCCIFCLARLRCTQSVVKCLKNLVTDIGYDKDLRDHTKLHQLDTLALPDYQICVSLNSLTQDQGTIDLMLEFLSDRHDNWHKHNTTHWILGKYGYLMSFCIDYISQFNENQRNLFFSFKDFDDDLPSHYAYKDNYIEFCNAINGLLGKEEIKKMWATGNYCSFKYICLMLKNVLKEVCNKLYHETDVDIEYFLYDELPKLKLHADNKIPFRNELLRFEPLYKKKLLNLILLRVLCNENIKDFLLTTHCTNTFFDDIILRYKANHTHKTRMIFVKIIHRNTKHTTNETFTLESGLKSYLFIKGKFTNKHEIICQGSMQNIDCRFIIYSTLKKMYTNIKLVESSDKENIIIPDKQGKIFQLIYNDEDINLLLPTILKSRAIELAKTLSMYIFSSSLFSSMAGDDFLRIYHAFLAQNVIVVESVSLNHCICTFREEFLKSKEESIVHMRREICERMAYQKIIQQNEAESMIQSYYFKLPIEFSQHYFGFNEDGTEQQEGFQNVCSIFEKLFQNFVNYDSEHIVYLDENSVGPDEIIQESDLVGNKSLAGLVGRLLINDDETDMLKFNFNETSLSTYNINILRHLSKRYDLKKYRFNINIHNFPKLSLSCVENDRELVRDFLSKLRFYYTKQININKIEKVLKNEIYKHFILQRKHHDARFRVHCDTIFLTNLKYCIKYPGIYRCNIYNTTDLQNYKVPIPRPET